MDPKDLFQFINSLDPNLDVPSAETYMQLKLVACNPATPCEILEVLCRFDCPDLLERIAANPSIRPDLLDSLAEHPQAEVRVAACDNPNANQATILRLAQDESVDVRYALAENHSLSPDVLNILADDDNPYVAYRAQQTLNRVRQAPSMTTRVFRWFQKNDHGTGNNLSGMG